MALVDSVLDFCGLTTDFTTEINENNASCKADLVRVGVLEDNIVDTDPHIITACKLYSAYMRDINGKGEIFRRNYEELRNSLAENEDYITEADDDV